MRYRAVGILYILFSWTENQNIWLLFILYYILFLLFILCFESGPLFIRLFLYFVIHVRGAFESMYLSIVSVCIKHVVSIFIIQNRIFGDHMIW